MLEPSPILRWKISSSNSRGEINNGARRLGGSWLRWARPVLTKGDRLGNGICFHSSSSGRDVALLETGARQKPAQSLNGYRHLSAASEFCGERAERSQPGFSFHCVRRFEHSTPRAKCSAACVRLCSALQRAEHGCRTDDDRDPGNRT